MWSLLTGFLGLSMLTLGSELLIRGGRLLGESLKLSSTVIGIVIVGYGTSLPELSSSLGAVVQNKPEMALGNVLGSNIFNVLFILGLSALITPMKVSDELLKKSLPTMILVSAGAFLLAYFLVPPAVLGGLLLGTFVAFTWISLKSQNQEDAPELKRSFSIVAVVQVVLGLGLLIFGTKFFIEGAEFTARWWGVSEAVIGLSVVAIGTSLPEVFSSLAAAFKGERSLVLGNIVGSNIFNLSAVLGSSLIFSQTLDAKTFLLDWSLMLFAAFICWPIFLSSKKVTRKEGAFLLVICMAYFSYLLRLPH